MPCTEIATAHTMAFLERYLPPAPARVLEVGCGRGEVLAALAAEGHHADGIDIDGAAVAAARALGAPARQANFFTLGGTTADVVLFTRSLHHLAPLEGAIDRAYQILAPGGVIIVEDFAIDAMDAVTATWFYDLCAMLGVAGALSPVKEAPADPLARWVAEHEPHHGHEPLHTGASMARAIAARFTVLATERVPCLYRTIVQHSGDARLGKAFLDLEERRIASGHLQPIGLRIVARR